MGVGPALALVLLPAIALVVVLHRAWPEPVLMTQAPHLAFRVTAVILIAIGLALWGASARVIERAFREKRLLTTGAYAIVRHPMYCGLLVFVVPGIALWLRSWPLLAVPVVAVIAFTRLIGREERYLEQTFGQAFLDYKARVHLIVPFVRPRASRSSPVAG